MKKMKIIIWNCLLFAELAGVGPGEDGEPFNPARKAKLDRGGQKLRWGRCTSVSKSMWQIISLRENHKFTGGFVPFLSWERCRLLCIAETSPARPWRGPAWCASPLPPSEPNTPPDNRTPPAGETCITSSNHAHKHTDSDVFDKPKQKCPTAHHIT